MAERGMVAMDVTRLARGAGLALPVQPLQVDDACSGAESFALMVLGESMMPEFEPGDIVIIEPDGRVASGSYVLAFWNDEWLFRQLNHIGGSWSLCPLDARYDAISIPDLGPVRGVIIQKSKPGRRRASKRYVG